MLLGDERGIKITLDEEAHFLAITNMISLFADFTKEIKRIRNDIIENIDKRMSLLNDNLSQGRKEVLLKEVKTYVTEKAAVPNINERFYENFLGTIPEKLRPGQIAEQIRKDGITIKGAKVKLDNFEKYSNKEIVEGFNKMAQKIASENEQDLSKLWGMDYENSFFDDSHPTPNDFTIIANQFSDSTKPYLNFDQSDINPEEFHRVVCGVMYDKKIERNWFKILQNKFSNLDLVEGKYGNKATLIGFNLGIPSLKLFDLENWYADYLYCIFNTLLPVHTKKGGVYMPEPFIDITYKPDEFIDQLFKVLIYEEIIEKTDDSKYRYNLIEDEMREEYKEIFYDQRKKEKNFVSEEKFKIILTKNYLLHKELKDKLINILIEKSLHQGMNLDEYRDLFIEQETNEIEKENWIDFFKELNNEINKFLKITNRI